MFRFMAVTSGDFRSSDYNRRVPYLARDVIAKGMEQLLKKPHLLDSYEQLATIIRKIVYVALEQLLLKTTPYQG